MRTPPTSAASRGKESDHWSYHSNIRAAAGGRRRALRLGDHPGHCPRRPWGDRHPRHRRTPTPRHHTREAGRGPPSLTGPNGTITAGNSSGIADGGAALLLVDREYALANGMDILATVRSWNSCGIEPARTGLAPTICVPRALERAGLSTNDVDLVEINEAFASMAVACSRKLGFSHDIVNVNGGAVGIGHPVAASGARILVTLIHELRRRGGGIGVGTLRAGGGMGSATVLGRQRPLAACVAASDVGGGAEEACEGGPHSGERVGDWYRADAEDRHRSSPLGQQWIRCRLGGNVGWNREEATDGKGAVCPVRRPGRWLPTGIRP